MTEDSLEKLREKVRREKAEHEVREDFERRDAERKKLNKELRDIKLKKFKQQLKPVASFFGSLADAGGKIATNLETNDAKSKFSIGQIITITNGGYSGTKMKISAFIPGGILGYINNQEIRIRHGSYKK